MDHLDVCPFDRTERPGKTFDLTYMTWGKTQRVTINMAYIEKVASAHASANTAIMFKLRAPENSGMACNLLVCLKRSLTTLNVFAYSVGEQKVPFDYFRIKIGCKGSLRSSLENPFELQTWSGVQEAAVQVYDVNDVDMSETIVHPHRNPPLWQPSSGSPLLFMLQHPNTNLHQDNKLEMTLTFESTNS